MAVLLPLVVFAVIVLLAVWLLVVRRNRGAPGGGAVVLPKAADGSIRVPVRSLFTSGGVFGAKRWNSLSPMLTILPDRLRFRVFRDSDLPFAHIEQIEVRRGLFGGAYLVALGEGGSSVLAIGLADAAVAKAVLAQLPRTIPLTSDAAMLRDGRPDAATPGLRRYRGPVR